LAKIAEGVRPMAEIGEAGCACVILRSFLLPRANSVGNRRHFTTNIHGFLTVDFQSLVSARLLRFFKLPKAAMTPIQIDTTGRFIL
jgi:hypothetical protein